MFARPVPDSPAERYVLVQCGAPAPKLEGDLVGAQIVNVPISSLYSASTTHLPLLVDLQRLDVLTGVSQMKYLTGDEILKRASERTGSGVRADLRRSTRSWSSRNGRACS